MAKGVTSITGLMRIIFSNKSNSRETVFYRGHSDRESFKLLPSVMRSDAHYRNESDMQKELFISNSEDFDQDKSHFDKMVRMQHFFLPTRLLDITTNPLIAAFFACSENPEKTGEILVFRVPNHLVRFYDDEGVSVLANLSRISYSDKLNINLDTYKGAFSMQDPIRKLSTLVREDHPNFSGLLDPDDVNNIICAKCKLNNIRINSQSGAFLVFGHGANEQTFGRKGIKVERISVKSSEKAKIMGELDSLSINLKNLFPGIEYTARYVRDSYC